MLYFQITGIWEEFFSANKWRTKLVCFANQWNSKPCGIHTQIIMKIGKVDVQDCTLFVRMITARQSARPNWETKIELTSWSQETESVIYSDWNLTAYQSLLASFLVMNWIAYLVRDFCWKILCWISCSITIRLCYLNQQHINHCLFYLIDKKHGSVLLRFACAEYVQAEAHSVW